MSFQSKNDNKEKAMATPSSLASVAANGRKPGTSTLGIGLEARGVHAWFGKHHALANVSLDFPAGTVTALTETEKDDNWLNVIKRIYDAVVLGKNR